MSVFAAHHCHAEACTTEVPPRMFMCAKHWRKVPKRDQEILYSLYVPGQEITKTPTMEYLTHARHCIDLVAKKEGLR